MKKSFKPGCMEAPLPVVMVSCGEGKEKNIITIAWTGIVNSEPPMTYISVRPERHSYDIIKNSGEFVINLVSEELVKACDWCGVKSGAKFDKWKEMKLTPEPADTVKCPMIGESPVNLECKVVESHDYPTHTMFVAEIVGMHVDEGLIDEKGRIALEEANLVAYSHGEYMPLKRRNTGTFGFSVMKKSTKRKRAQAARANKTKK
ncbi:MAG: flavin reductase family protein [Firmicutes bacterium]|nr:flavin reductase family protein [Bacillota bacterium]